MLLAGGDLRYSGEGYRSAVDEAGVSLDASKAGKTLLSAGILRRAQDCLGRPTQSAGTGDPDGQPRRTFGRLRGLEGLSGRARKAEGASTLHCNPQASMECLRRAMVHEQTFEGRRENLNQANKLSRTWATLLEALNRYRGKGQQKVTVEHVHVHAGGQAVVGTIEQNVWPAPSASGLDWLV